LTTTARDLSSSEPTPGVLGSIEKPLPFADAAFEHLRRELLPGGSLFDSSRLVEEDLARMLGMSRTPVREALHRLALVGILEPAAGGGYALRRFTRREIVDHYELRILLEPVAARLAALLPNDRRAAVSSEPDLVDAGRSADGNTRFHKAVARTGGNRSLTRLIEQLVDRLAREGVYARGTEDDQRILRSGHDEIVRAISEGEADLAERTMRDHLRKALDVLIGSRPRASTEGVGSPPTRDAGRSADGQRDFNAARERLGEGAYAQLRAAILDGRLAPGSILAEATVAEALSVSRTPTRFALRQLESEGFVDRDDRGRLVVHALDRRELEELFEVRTVVEAHASRLAVGHISDDELDRLDQLLAADLNALRRNDTSELQRLNELIHGAVLTACRSHALIRVSAEVRERVYGFGFSAFAVGNRKDRRQFVDDHAALVRAIREGEPDVAAAVTERHIGAALRLLANSYNDYATRRAG
jgi:DNA-binding GntR family transcriptional regulator